VHADASPHSTVHAAEPLQPAVHPPVGHTIVHALLPVQSSDEPEPIVTLHALPPEHVTLASAPADRSQLAPPAH
jgi:hypothetical protein